MNSPPPDESDAAALKARMHERLERARAAGQSPEQIEATLRAAAREEAAARAPAMAARARSWWTGVKRALLVGLLALLTAAALAWAVEQRYAAPLCSAYAAGHGLRYLGLDYPVLGRSSSTSSMSGRCRLQRADGARDSVGLDKLESNGLRAFAVSVALQIELTFCVAFVAIALLMAWWLRVSARPRS